MAIRLNFITMKKILILAFVCVLSYISYAQDMKIIFSGQNATITIGEKTFDQETQIDVRKEIKTIEISETPNLTSSQKHFLKVNGRKINLSDNNASLKIMNTFNVTPFTLKFSDIITVFRGDSLCSTFHVQSEPISKEEVLKSVNFKTEDIKSLKPGEKRNVELELQTSPKITLENIKIVVGNKDVSLNQKNNKLKFELNIEDNVKSADVKVYYDVKGHTELQGLEFPLYTVTVESSTPFNKRNVIVGIIALFLLGIIIFIAYWFTKSTLIRINGKKKTPTEVGEGG